MMEKPFVYVAALRRTGSTMLCEGLTKMPYCVVLNEPNFADKAAIIREHERNLLEEAGIDVEAFLSRWSGWRRRFIMQGVRRDLVPKLSSVIQQFGVKEIFNDNWTRYQRAFPNMRTILTARDPS